MAAKFARRLGKGNVIVLEPSSVSINFYCHPDIVLNPKSANENLLPTITMLYCMFITTFVKISFTVLNIFVTNTNLICLRSLLCLSNIPNI